MMTKNDLRARVYQAADELFIETGSLHGIGQRAVRDRAKGGSNDVGPLFDDWRASREAMLSSRPASLAAIAEEFAGRLWLMAQLLSAATGQAPLSAAATTAPPPAPARQATRSAPVRAKPAAGTSAPESRRGASKDTGLFSEMARPERPAKVAKPSPQRTANIRRFQIREGGGKPFILVAPKPPALPVALSEADWKGAKDEKCAEAAATILRKNGDRMRSFELYKKLPKNLRPGSLGHAQRDLQKAFAGSRIKWSPGGWFWFEGEALPVHRERLGTPDAETRHKGDVLWWRIAHTIVELGRDFTRSEIEEACGNQLENFGETWLRLRLKRMCDRDPPFLQSVSSGVLRWTGLSPAEVVVED